MNNIIGSVGISFTIVVLIAVAIAVLEIGIMNVGHAQVFQKTPGENPACDPTDTSINASESRVCGVPKTPSATGAAAEAPSSITPNQNPACDPTDTSINASESRVCGVPKTPSATGAAAEPTTTESPSSITPPPSGSSLEPIPGLLPITTNSTQ
jgi:hypothetical protein